MAATRMRTRQQRTRTTSLISIGEDAAPRHDLHCISVACLGAFGCRWLLAAVECCLPVYSAACLCAVPLAGMLLYRWADSTRGQPLP